MTPFVTTFERTFTAEELEEKKEKDLPQSLVLQFPPIERALFEAGMCCVHVGSNPVKHCGEPSDPLSPYGYCIAHLADH